MGCLHSKEEASDLHPNVFRVVNIDEHGGVVGTGQLEVTDTNIVLYREGREPTVWPLHSLRRYGFDEDVFSFESGRRCDTGEGIYAFKCKRAPVLFRVLQNQILLRNVIHDSTPYPVSRINPSPQGRQTLQASVVHRSSVDNGQPDTLRPVNNVNLIANSRSAEERNANNAIRSPSSADILEVMPLYPRPQAAGNHTSNVYQVREYKRENNNNQDAADSLATEYSNDFNRDLAMLRNTLRQEGGLFQMKDEDEPHFVENGYTNAHIANNQTKSPLSPTLSTTSEHYAQLTLEQQEESARYYCNVDLTNKALQEFKRVDATFTTPPTPVDKQADISNLSLAVKEVNMNSYANLSLGEPLNFTEYNHKYSESDTFTSLSPVEELEVNYAVLDIDANKSQKGSRETASPPSLSYSSPKYVYSIESCSTQRRSFLISQCSVDKNTTSNESAPSVKNGYTTIDFDKTVALTLVAADAADADSEGPRKKRHNSCICASPNSGDKHKI